MLKRLSFLAAAVLCLWTCQPCGATGDAQRTQTLTAILKSDAPFYDKARACQQLGEIGTADAVPALAALLADEHLGAYARSGLEGIADPSAAAALREALSSVKGARLCGVIDSLGIVRDSQAVPALCKFASDPASGVVKDALLALGRIATPDAIDFLRKTLSNGPESSRSDAAAACILAAEQQTASESTAVALYDEVRKANVPASYRIAATRGAIIARKSNAAPFLIEQLETGDAAVRLAVLTTIREIPSDTLATALNTELAKAAPDLQRQLIVAMLDCHNDGSLAVLRAKATADSPGIRECALTVLGQIGGAADAQVLLSAIAANRSANDVSVATAELRRMNTPGIDPLIVQALATATDAELRIKLIRLLGARKTTTANAELLRQASSPDANTGVAALGVLSSLAGANELPPLIALAKSTRDTTVKSAVESALANTSERVGEPATEALLAELQQAKDAGNQLQWVRILAAAGSAKALPALQPLMNSANDELAAGVIEQLGKWPDPTPTENLLVYAEAGSKPNLRHRARASALQLAANAVDEHQRPDPVVIPWLQRAARGAEAAELRQLISILGRIKQPDSFRTLQPFMDNATVRLDAARALIQIAQALLKTDVAPAVKQELQKITPSLDPDLAAKAAAIH